MRGIRRSTGSYRRRGQLKQGVAGSMYRNASANVVGFQLSTPAFSQAETVSVSDLDFDGVLYKEMAQDSFNREAPFRARRNRASMLQRED